MDGPAVAPALAAAAGVRRPDGRTTSSASYDAGLATRPIGDTARDTLAWLRDHPDAAVTGLSRDDEAEVLGRLARAGADADSPRRLWSPSGPGRDAIRRGLSPDNLSRTGRSP